MSALALDEIGNENSNDQCGLEAFAESDDECAEHDESVIEPSYLRNSNVA
jgi:hypothetical protein